MSQRNPSLATARLDAPFIKVEAPSSAPRNVTLERITHSSSPIRSSPPSPPGYQLSAASGSFNGSARSPVSGQSDLARTVEAPYGAHVSTARMLSMESTVTRQMTIKGTTFTIGEPLSNHQFTILDGYTRDVMDDLKTLHTIRKSHDDMTIEINKKDLLLKESDALIEQLRGGESADIHKFKVESTQQLRAQCDKIVALNNRVQDLTTENTNLETKLVSTQLKDREFELENDRLTRELDRLTKELDCFRTSAGRLGLEMKDLTMSMDERVMTTKRMQEHIEQITKEADDRVEDAMKANLEDADQLKALNDVLICMLDCKDQNLRILGDMLTDPSVQCEPTRYPKAVHSPSTANMKDELSKIGASIPKVCSPAKNLTNRHTCLYLSSFLVPSLWRTFIAILPKTDPPP